MYMYIYIYIHTVGSTRESTSALDWAQWTLGYIKLTVSRIPRGVCVDRGIRVRMLRANASRVMALRVFNAALDGLVAGVKAEKRA